MRLVGDKFLALLHIDREDFVHGDLCGNVAPLALVVADILGLALLVRDARHDEARSELLFYAGERRCVVEDNEADKNKRIDKVLERREVAGDRYYDPLQGRYITQDPIGLKGGWNLYGYQLNPISDIDPLGLSMWEDAKSGACTNGLCGTLSAMTGPDKFDSIDSTAYDALNKINSQSICEDKEFAGLICKDNSGRYFSTAPNRGERKGSYPFNSPCPNGTEKVSAYHTHGADSHGEYWDEIFSGKDEKIVKSKDNNIKSFYLGTPSGNFKAIDNHGKEITNRKGLPNVCRVHGNM